MTYGRWQRLIDANYTEYYAGTVFQFPAKWPYEDIVDLMLFSDGLSSEPELRVVVTTGSKAGYVNIVAIFPKEAYVEGLEAISADGLKDNWQEWVYADCKAEDVFVMQNYPTPSSLPRM